MNKKKIITVAVCIVLWVAIWQIASVIINNEIFLPGPVKVSESFFSLAKTSDFYAGISFSAGHIALGFIIGVSLGIILAIISSLSAYAETFISIPVKILRTVPVASFVILALLWVNAENLSVLISAFMVCPVIYTNVLTGLKNTEIKMLQMAQIFRFTRSKKIWYVYLPAVYPQLHSAMITCAGLAWKSGIAAEIIGLIRHSIGNRLYQSKIYLQTDELFAWTITIIIISLIFEQLLKLLLKLIAKSFGGVTND